MAQHLEVLGTVLARLFAVAQMGGEADSLERRLRHAADPFGRIDLQQLEQRRQHVDRVHEALAQSVPFGKRGGPRDEEGDRATATVCLALPSTERRVGSCGLQHAGPCTRGRAVERTVGVGLTAPCGYVRAWASPGCWTPPSIGAPYTPAERVGWTCRGGDSLKSRLTTMYLLGYI